MALAVIALLGAFGTVIGFMSGDDSATTQDAEATIQALTAERADLVARATELQAEIDTLGTARDGLVAQIAERDATLDVQAAELDRLTARLAEVETTLATRTAERDAAVARVTELEASLAAQVALTLDAIAQRNALAKVFPMDLEASLDDVAIADLVGTYEVELTKVFCTEFASCATLPSIDELTIRTTPEGWLELVIPKVVTAGLFPVDGALYTIANGTLPLASCGGTPRPAEITITMYPHGLRAAPDGTARVVDLGASITVQASALAGCPAGVAFYGAQITP